MKTGNVPRRFVTRLNSLILVGLFIILAAVVAVPFYSAQSSSPPSGVLSDEPSNVSGSGLPLLTVGRYSSLFTPPQGPPPPGSPFPITLYAGNCSTPKTVFDVQDTDKTVCAKITGGAPTFFRLIWSNANQVAVQDVPVGAGQSTFTLTTGSSLGDWRVIAFEPFGGAIYTVASFTVLDSGNPSADLSISKSVLSDSVSSGGQVTFSIQVTNGGPSDAATVQVSDSIPANTTFSSFAPISGPGFNCANPSGGSSSGTTVCTIANLARGESAIFLATYDVTGGAGTVISNTASVSSVFNDPTPATPDPRDINNSSTADITVSAATSEVCTLDCPDNVVVTANTTSGGQPGAFVTYGAASGTGNCGAISNTPQSGSFFTVGSHPVTSNSDAGESCIFTVTVLDTTPPTITCPPDITVTAPVGSTEATLPSGPGTPTINASGGGTVTGVRSDNIPATFDQNGNVLTPAVIHALTDPYPIGTTGIFWTVTDAGGRTASCSQKITVLENNRQPVTIACPANVTVAASSGSCQATISSATIGTPTTNPSDSGVSVAAVRSDGLALTDPFPAGATLITWTATDKDTNGVVISSASCVQSVTVTVTNSGDTTPPTLVVPPNVTTTTSSCTATLDDELGAAEASDTGACGGSVTITRTGVPANFIFPTGTTIITYTATDAAGNTATGTQLVTVLESPAIPPTVTAPANVTVNTGPGATVCGTVVGNATLGTASASDNCPGVTVARTGVPIGNLFPVGDTFITYTATDKSGNTATATQKVTVVDDTLPVVTAPGPVTLFTGTGATSCDVTVSNLNGTLGTGSASDNCPGVSAVTRTGVPAGNVFPLGPTTLTYSATDANGNTSSASQIVTVIDNTPPTITINGANPQYVECHTSYPELGATAHDNCSADFAATPSGSVDPNTVGTYTITYNATDPSGNAATPVTRVVIVQDTIAPTITLNGVTPSLWPPNHAYHTFGVTDFVTSVTDSCDTSLGVSDVVIEKVTSDEAENANGSGNTLNDIVIASDCKSVQLRSEREGGGNGRVYTITFKVSDGYNTTRVTAKVVVQHNPGEPAVDSGPHYTVTSNCGP